MSDTTIGPGIDSQAEGTPCPAAAAVPERMRAARRDPEDDFYCIRFDVWYPSIDCAYRTKFRTSPGCLHCEQGRFNHKRHAAALRGVRFPFPEE
jgi:hypothetical protein